MNDLWAALLDDLEPLPAEAQLGVFGNLQNFMHTGLNREQGDSMTGDMGAMYGTLGREIEEALRELHGTQPKQG